MAKSKESFNKKSKEQKRQKKKQDKAQKMEDRKKDGKKNSLEDMMAYVDEDGNISDTPPDHKVRRKEINLEDIQISIPAGNERDNSRSGTVQFFNDEKGFGFIIDDINQQRIFLHTSNLSEPVQLNDKVQYEVERGERGPVAVNVTKKAK